MEQAPDAEPTETDDPGYVPMSQWIDDFERAERSRNR